MVDPRCMSRLGLLAEEMVSPRLSRRCSVRMIDSLFSEGPLRRLCGGQKCLNKDGNFGLTTVLSFVEREVSRPQSGSNVNTTHFALLFPLKLASLRGQQCIVDTRQAQLASDRSLVVPTPILARLD